MIDRRLFCAGALSAAALPALTRPRPNGSTLMIFTDAQPGQEARFAAWWSAELTRLARARGVAAVEDYRRAPVRLRAGAEPMPAFLALATLAVPPAPVFVRFLAAVPAAGGAAASLRTILYRNGGSWRGATPPSAGAAYLQIVLDDASPGQVAAYEAWYATHHGPELAAVPGVTRIDFGRRAPLPATLRYGGDAPAYLSAMRFATGSVPTFKAALEQAAKTTVQPTTTYDLAHAWRETYALAARYT